MKLLLGLFVIVSSSAWANSPVEQASAAHVWRDNHTGLEWTDVADGSSPYEISNGLKDGQMNLGQASNYCKQFGMDVPSKEDFKAANSHGIRAAVRNVSTGASNYFGGRWFVSNSFDTPNGNYGKTFNGFTGEIDTMLTRHFPWFVVCVSVNRS